MTTRSIRLLVAQVAAGAGICLLTVTACSSSSSTKAPSSGTTAASEASVGSTAASSATTEPSSTTAAASSGNPCTLVTVAELSQAVGVHYISISGPGGGLCDVKGPGAASFDYTVGKESPTNTWSQQVATIKGDDGQALSEPGIGDRAVWGGKEFAAEADGYIVGVIGADFPSTPQGSGFTRTGRIAKLLISKL